MQVWLELGEDWRAVQCAHRAVELQPGWAPAHLTLGRAQVGTGWWESSGCSRLVSLQYIFCC